MASYIQVQEALARERTERRRLARRKSYDSQQQRKQIANELIAETKQKCEEVLASSQNEAASILAKAKREAAGILERSEIEFSQWRARKEDIRSGIVRLEARLDSLTRQASSQNAEPDPEVIVAHDAAVANFRKRDAARKRDEYHRKRQSSEDASSGRQSQRSRTAATRVNNLGGDGAEQSETCSNRSQRSVHRLVSTTVSEALD